MHAVAFESAEAGEHAEFFHPLFGNDAEGAVVQAHRLLAVLDRAQQARHADFALAELGGAVDAEPIDAGIHMHRQRPSGAVKAPLGLDMPTFGGQYTHHPGQLIGRQLQIAAVVFPALAKTQLLEPRERLVFRGEIAGHQTAPFLLIKTAASFLLRHDRAVVIERQLRGEPFAAPTVAFAGFQKQPRLRHAGNGFELQFGRQLQARPVGDRHQLVEKHLAVFD